MAKAVLFDLDGTLVDTLSDLASATNAVLAAFELPTHSEESYRRFVGNGARNLVAGASGVTDEAQLDVMLARFLAEYQSRLLVDSRPYDGVVETLDILLSNGIRLAVVTNKPHAQAVQLTKHWFGDRFSAIYGGCDAYPKKPDPQSAKLAITDLGVEISDCVFVGDSDVDVFTAHRLDIPCIGCAFGFRGAKELETAGADSIVYSFADLQKNKLIFE